MKYGAWTKWNERFVCCAKLIPGFLVAQAEKASVRIRPVDTSAPFARARTFQELSEIETQLGNHESRILQMNNSKETLSKRLLELTELKHVLKETATFFDEVGLLK